MGTIAGRHVRTEIKSVPPGQAHCAECIGWHLAASERMVDSPECPDDEWPDSVSIDGAREFTLHCVGTNGRDYSWAIYRNENTFLRIEW